MYKQEYVKGKTKIAEDLSIGKSCNGIILSMRGIDGVCRIMELNLAKELIGERKLILVNRHLSTDNKLVARSRNSSRAMNICFSLHKPAVRKAVKETAMKMLSMDGINISLSDDIINNIVSGVSASIAEEVSNGEDNEILKYRCMPDDSMREKVLAVAKTKQKLLVNMYVMLAIKEYVKYVEKTTV